MPENLQDSEKSATFALANEKYRGVEQLVARQAHNLEVACSSPASATHNDITSCKNNELCRFLFYTATKIIEIDCYLCLLPLPHEHQTDINMWC